MTSWRSPMLRSDHKAFEKLVRQMAANFRAEVSTLFLQAMWMGLSDLPLVDLKKAVVRAMRDCEYMPPVAKLREMVRADKVRAFPTPEEERARIAAEKAERRRIVGTWDEVKRIGPTEPVTAGEVVSELVERLRRGAP